MFPSNFEWQKKFYPQIINILKRNAMHVVKIDVADMDADTKKATDFVVTVKGGSVAVRIRRDVAQKYQDFTIRAQMRSGYETELHKIKKGFADFYLYVWTQSDSITRWILINLQTMRESGSFNAPREVRWNKDGGSAFIYFAIDELKKIGALISEWKQESAK